jgi:histidinol phosphatase-like enzyme (inositol monophosphatase family)
MSQQELDEMQLFAEGVAQQAAKVIRSYADLGLRVDTKNDASPVTEADREAERLIRAQIHERFPGHAVLGEEGGFEAGDGSVTWVVDPIDGTRSFIAGVPLYATLIAAIEGAFDGTNSIEASRALVGVIELPAQQRAVSASRGNGARARTPDGRFSAARVSDVTSLEKAIICTTDYADLARRDPELHQRIVESQAQCRTWGDAFGYYLVATGKAEVMIDPIMNPWDVAPLPVIIEEAGGSFLALDGTSTIGESVIASNGRLERLRR